jgi:hypothetical protein
MKSSTTICFALSMLAFAIGTAVAGQSESGNAPSTQQSAPATPQTFDPEALARAQQKLAHAQQVADRFSAQAKEQGLNENWRLTLIGDLMKGSEDQFARVENAASLIHAIGAATALAHEAGLSTGGQAKDLGTTTSDLVFVPISPCRIVDTRAGTGTGFTAGQTEVYSFKNSNVGASTSCNVFFDYSGADFPAALAVNITVDESTFSGFQAGKFLSVFPDGGTLGSSFMNFGPGEILANAGIITINQSNGLFDVKSTAPAQVIIDVFGVFLAPVATALDCTQVQGATASLGSGSAESTPVASCPTGYKVTGGACTSNSNLDRVASSGFELNGYFCFFSNETTSDISINAVASCCRTPGR